MKIAPRFSPARLGFELWHSPGISRAWRSDLPDGSVLLVTDPEGYDLPPLAGPYVVLRVATDEQLLENRRLARPRQLWRWRSRLLRQALRAAHCSTPPSPSDQRERAST
jgi:hypothetical protein